MNRYLLESTVVRLRRTAAVLHANGCPDQAVRAECAAMRMGLLLDHSQAARRLLALTRILDQSSHTGWLLERALEGAMALSGGDFGNIQIRDLTSGKLTIAAQSGFSSEFLEYFAAVEDDASACGRAARRGSQTVIADVDEDRAFAPHREIAAASRFRAVQSTPLFDPDGRLYGVVSTHFRSRHQPSLLELRLLQWYAEHVGAALARGLDAPTKRYDATTRLRVQTADLLDASAALLSDTARTPLASGYTTT